MQRDERPEYDAAGVRCGIAPETIAAIAPLLGGAPVAGAIVLGSGLGSLLDAWPVVTTVAGAEIPGYPLSTVPGHAGRLAIVRWGPGGEQRGLVFQGRVHFYEGYGRAEVTFAPRLSAALGSRWIVFTNAAGSLDPSLTPGSVLVVEDHNRILLLGAGPLRGVGVGPSLRGAPYHPARTETLFRGLSAAGLRVMRGTLMGCLGPGYETAAEVEMARRIGAQAACMSTVVEVEEAARCGLEPAAVSLITNLATGLAGAPLTHEEVVEMAGAVGPRLAAALATVIEGWEAG